MSLMEAFMAADVFEFGALILVIMLILIIFVNLIGMVIRDHMEYFGNKRRKR
jgi:hypothetical protein